VQHLAAAATTIVATAQQHARESAALNANLMATESARDHLNYSNLILARGATGHVFEA
jgi:hypothetical protein